MNGDKRYIWTKSSVINRVRELSKFHSPKEVIDLINSKTRRPLLSDVSDNPRNRRQVYNAKRSADSQFKARGTGKPRTPDFGKLIASMNTKNMYSKC